LQGIDVDPATFLQENKHSEKLFNLFGAQEVTSLDYSSYEGADIFHDMNLPFQEICASDSRLSLMGVALSTFLIFHRG